MTSYLRVLFWLVACLLSAYLNAQTPTNKQATNLEELEQAIDTIRLKTNTPGVAVGLVQKNGKKWQYYSGLAQVESRTPMNENSQFRFGSISKMLVSLSILKLVEEKVLSLNDKLANIAPEVAFDNPWEATHPIKIVHLLSHSTGWDSPHFKEQRVLDSTPTAIMKALNTHPHSRTSRWPPGTGIAYNNTSFLVAAHIVEKVTGQAFEAFVKQYFFQPLNMNDSGYYFSENYRENAVSLYKNGRELPYRHLNNRAAGGLNSTINDMMSFIDLLTSKPPSEIVSAATLDTFQLPANTKAANDGLELTWGLGNQIFHANSVILHGHEGSLRGTNSILVYSREHDFGYVIVANQNGPAVAQIHRLLSQYFTQNIISAEVLPERKITNQDKQLSGWYQSVTPVSGKFSFLSTIIPWKLSFSEQSVSIKPLIGSPPRILIPSAKRNFKQNTTGLIALVPSKDEIFGDIIYYGPQTLAKTSAIVVFLPILIVLVWIIMSISALVFLLVWVPRKLLKKPISRAAMSLRVWPLISLAIAIFTLVCARLIVNHPVAVELMGRVSVLSSLIFIGSLGFFLSSLWSVRVWLQYRKEIMHKFTKSHSTIFIVANLLISILLLSNGLVGLRLWT
jgi:CubicO group peptidase (beta-lactamase class C family)